MLLDSLPAAAFLLSVVALNVAIGRRWRWALLLAASYVLIASFKPEYAIIIACATLVNYGLGIALGRRKSRALLAMGIAVNAAALIAFKYLTFLSESAAAALRLLSVPSTPILTDIILPLGISYYTFQNIGYLVDVWRRTVRPERHLGIFATFIAFFPKCAAGPIERSTNLLRQMRKRPRIRAGDIAEGSRLLLVGLFKKFAIADSVATTVSIVYSDPTLYGGIPLAAATILFAVQLYFDFSGYTDMARGGARLLGYNLLENFDRPYRASSVAEFWRRWHMSLSTWFRDYLYIPLGGNRVPWIRWAINTMVVFLVCGLWHGAAWTFVAWGGLHGTYLILGRATHGLRERAWTVIRLGGSAVRRLIANVWTVLLVVFGWILFRAQTLPDAWYITTHLGARSAYYVGRDMGIDAVSACVVIVLILVYAAYDRALRRGIITGLPLRVAVHAILLILLLLFGAFHDTGFIYAQF